MINTILKGLFSIVFTIMNTFLSPIYDAVADIDLGGFTVADTISQMNSFLTLIRTTLVWVADATGIPLWLFNIMGLFMLANITLRIVLYVLKLLLKWYRKLMP